MESAEPATSKHDRFFSMNSPAGSPRSVAPDPDGRGGEGGAAAARDQTVTVAFGDNDEDEFFDAIEENVFNSTSSRGRSSVERDVVAGARVADPGSTTTTTTIPAAAKATMTSSPALPLIEQTAATDAITAQQHDEQHILTTALSNQMINSNNRGMSGGAAFSSSPGQPTKEEANNIRTISELHNDRTNSSNYAVNMNDRPPPPPIPTEYVNAYVIGQGDGPPLSPNRPLPVVVIAAPDSSTFGANAADDVAGVSGSGGGGRRDSESSTGKYMVVNKDTGETFDLREIDKHLPTSQYHLLPTKRDLMLKGSGGGGSSRDMDDSIHSRSPTAEGENSSTGGNNGDGTGGGSSSSNAKKSHKHFPTEKFAKFIKIGGKSRRKSTEDIVPNHVRVSGCSSKTKGHDAEFGGLMLFQELKAHAGPVWVIAFSSGKATGSSSSSSASTGSGGGGFYESNTGGVGGVAVSPLVYLATAGQDTKINIYGVAGAGAPDSNNGGSGGAGGLRSQEWKPGGGSFKPVVGLVGDHPVRVFEGHGSDVVDLSWSPNNFLVSASLDKTARLWHMTQEGCLRTFKHSDIVTSVHFHPTLEALFLTGCFDKKIRIWNIPEGGRVYKWQNTQEMISAARFNGDGSLVVAGLFKGQVLFYETAHDLRFYTQIDCRNRRGPFKGGRKVTGLEFRRPNRRLSGLEAFMSVNNGALASAAAGGGGGGGGSFGRNSPLSSSQGGGGSTVTAAVASAAGGGAGTASPATSGPLGGVGAAPIPTPVNNRVSLTKQQIAAAAAASKQAEEILVTTNDSRIRLYRMEGFSLRSKYKGLHNEDLQIRASFSEDGQFIISGSEVGKVFIWSTDPNAQPTPLSLSKSGGGGSALQGSNSPTSGTSAAGGGAGSSGSNRGSVGGGSSSGGGAGGSTVTGTNARYESFVATEGDPPGFVTAAQFVPSNAIGACLMAMQNAANGSGGGGGGGGGYYSAASAAAANPNCMIVASDYEGVVRVYCKNSMLVGKKKS